MTDLPTPDDELVSAYLDGEVDVGERARVEGDPALLARSEELAAVRAALSAPVEAPPPGEVDRAIAAAVAAAAVAAPTGRDELARRREERRRSVPAWLSVAAVVLALLVGVPLLAGIGGGGDTDDETAAVESAGDSADSAEGGGGQGTGGADDTLSSDGADAPTTAMQLQDGGDLGVIEGEDDLREAVAPALAARTLEGASPAAGDAGASDFDDEGAAQEAPPGAAARPACELGEPGPPFYTATATYQGVAADVLAFQVAEGTRVVVVAAGGCDVLADVIV